MSKDALREARKLYPKLSRISVHYAKQNTVHKPSISLFSDNFTLSLDPQSSNEVNKKITKALPKPKRISNAVFLVMNNDFLVKKQSLKLKKQEFSDEISFFKNRSSFGSNKSVSVGALGKMNSIEKAFFTNYIFEKQKKTDVYISDILKNASHIREEMKQAMIDAEKQ